MSTAALLHDPISKPNSDPMSLPAVLERAREHHGQNRLREAAECYGEVLRANACSQTALLGLSLLARQTNQPESALKMAQAALACSLAHSPAAALAAAHLGHCLVSLRRIDEAQSAFENALAWTTQTNYTDRANDSCGELQQQTGIQAKIQAHVGLGELLSSTARPFEAIPHFRAAIELQSELAAAHFGLGSALSVTEKTVAGCESALASFKRAAQLAPQSPESHFGVAFIESRLGRHGDAVRGYRLAVKCRPSFASAWLNLGVELVADGHEEFAESCYRQAIAVLPVDSSQYLNARTSAQAGTEISAWLNLGHLFRGRRDFNAASREYEKALAIASEHRLDLNLSTRLLEIKVAFTYLYMEMGRLDQAWAALREAEAAENQESQNPEISNARGILILAEEYARIRPGSIGSSIIRPGKLDHTLIDPSPHDSNPTASFVRNIERAISAFEEAEALGHLTAASNRGNALLRIGRCLEGLAAHETACRNDPLSPGVRYNLALTQLRMGDYLQGWANYEIRWSFREIHPRPRQFLAPRWLGQQVTAPPDGNLTGHTVKLLIYGEQGLGDSLQFLRFLPLVAQILTDPQVPARAVHGEAVFADTRPEMTPRTEAHLILEVQSPLIRLFAPFLAELEVLTPGLTTELVEFKQPLPKFTHHFPLLSLAALFKITVKTVPVPRLSGAGYLRADPLLIAQRAAEIEAISLASIKTWKVGLAWAGNPNYRADYERSTCLKTFLPLLGLQAIRWFSLQKGQAQAQIGELPPDLRPYDGCSNDQDLADTAALVANLDLVITTDTAIAHLAGALGKPLWLLLPWQSDWRWMQDILTTPWYPTARLFRQSAPNDWEELVSRVVEELVELTARGAPAGHDSNASL